MQLLNLVSGGLAIVFKHWLALSISDRAALEVSAKQCYGPIGAALWRVDEQLRILARKQEGIRETELRAEILASCLELNQQLIQNAWLLTIEMKWSHYAFMQIVENLRWQHDVSNEQLMRIKEPVCALAGAMFEMEMSIASELNDKKRPKLKPLVHNGLQKKTNIKIISTYDQLMNI